MQYSVGNGGGGGYSYSSGVMGAGGAGGGGMYGGGNMQGGGVQGAGAMQGGGGMYGPSSMQSSMQTGSTGGYGGGGMFGTGNMQGGGVQGAGVMPGGGGMYGPGSTQTTMQGGMQGGMQGSTVAGMRGGSGSFPTGGMGTGSFTGTGPGAGVVALEPNPSCGCGSSPGDDTGCCVGGPGNACGGTGTMCCEEAGNMVSSTGWSYVGDGRGDFAPGNPYNYVGEGAGAYTRELVVTPYGCKLRPCCVVVALLCLLLPLLFAYYKIAPGTTTEAQGRQVIRAPAPTSPPPPPVFTPPTHPPPTTPPPTTPPTTPPPPTAPPTTPPPPPTTPPTTPPPPTAPPTTPPPPTTLPPTTPKPTTLAPAPVGPLGTCTLWGDPHIRSFDSKRADYYSPGEYWVVKSKDVWIQGRYLPTHSTSGLGVTKIIAVGGPFIKPHKLFVSSTTATWDDEPILTSFPSDFSVPGVVEMHYNNHGKILQKGRQGKPLHIVHMKFEDGTPEGLEIQVNRWTLPEEGNYINVRITMHAREGMDGHCGNFNADAEDDDRLQVRARIGEEGVAREELLFKTKTPVVHTGRPDINDCPEEQLNEAHEICKEREQKFIPSMHCLVDVCFGGKGFADGAGSVANG